MIQPIRNQVIFKPLPGDEITEGGIFVPDNFRLESDKGTIVSVGKGTKNKPMYLKPNTVGYRVHKWGVKFEENGEIFYLMEDSAIIALA